MVDLSPTSRARVYLGTIVGTLASMVVAMTVDSYSFGTGEWRWGSDPFNNVLIPAIIAPPLLFGLLSKMRELALAHAELLIAASTDALTHCLNRRAFSAMVEGYLDALQGKGAFLIIDVDHFKRVNDQYGHSVGDEALAAVASSIRSALGKADLLARLGGEEFGVLLPVADLNAAWATAERIRRKVAELTITARHHPLRLSVSVGGVAFEKPASFQRLYRAADALLYGAKRDGRNKVIVEPA
jgi:diguanylate cyclase